MRHFIALFLIFGLSVFTFGQRQQTQTRKNKRADLKTKPKPKPKTKPEITTIEAATKDGKAVILKSNGTWEYTKVETDKKNSSIPNPNPSPKPTPVTAVAAATPTPKPTPVPTPDIAAKPTKTNESKQCELTLTDSPAIRGLQLGMSRTEVDRIIPQDRVRILNSSAISAYPQFGKTAGFENIYNITAQFLDEKLNLLEIVYDPTAVKWKNSREFAENLSENLKLPLRFWKHKPGITTVSEMRCREFALEIDSEANQIRLERIFTLQSNEPTKEQVQEKDNKSFKP